MVKRIKKRVPRGVAKYIRAQKADIRRRIPDEKAREDAIRALMAQFSRTSRKSVV